MFGGEGARLGVRLVISDLVLQGSADLGLLRERNCEHGEQYPHAEAYV